MQPNTITTWSQAIQTSFLNVWLSIVNFIPDLIAALVVLTLGIAAAVITGRLVRQGLRFTRIDALADRAGVEDLLEGTGVQFSIASAAGWIVKWFIIIAILIAVAETLGLEEITEFLQRVALYIPHVVIAAAIFLLGLIVARFVHQVVQAALRASRLSDNVAPLLAGIAKWAIIIFAAMAALSQLGIAQGLIEIMLTGFILTIALAVGIAFGLGGKEKAAHLLNKIEKELT